MWKRIFLVGVLLLVVGGFLYWEFRTPPGVETMGDSVDLWISIFGLFSAVVGLAASIISIIAVFIQLKGRGG